MFLLAIRGLSNLLRFSDLLFDFTWIMKRWSRNLQGLGWLKTNDVASYVLLVTTGSMSRLHSSSQPPITFNLFIPRSSAGKCTAHIAAGIDRNVDSLNCLIRDRATIRISSTGIRAVIATISACQRSFIHEQVHTYTCCTRHFI